jgi:hypothetical protein
MQETDKDSSFDIKHENHFKLYVAVEDRFTFETELTKNGIQYYVNTDEQVYVGSEIRYFLKDMDRKAIDKVVLENEISTALESYSIVRPILSQKLFVRLIILIVIIFGIIIIADLLLG